VKTEYSQDLMPLHQALAALILEWCRMSVPGDKTEWVFQNPVTKRPYHQEQIQKRFFETGRRKSRARVFPGLANFSAYVSGVA
jgi:hypothetical protein